MSLCLLRVIPQRFLNSVWQRVSDNYWRVIQHLRPGPLLPTLLIATLCLCALLTILYYSLVVAWEVFWASWQSPLLLDPSAEVVLTVRGRSCVLKNVEIVVVACRQREPEPLGSAAVPFGDDQWYGMLKLWLHVTWFPFSDMTSFYSDDSLLE